MILRSLIILLFVFGSVFIAFGQEKSGPKEKTFKQELKSNKQIRKEKREKKWMERQERKKVKKHHKRIQTKKVRKRMKESRKTAVRYNENKREFFLKRWLKKKVRKR